MVDFEGQAQRAALAATLPGGGGGACPRTQLYGAECLMPGLMTVDATVTSATAGGGTASFAGVARVTLAKGNPFGLPAGILATNAPFSGSAVAGGPGTGSEDLKVLGMDFPGTIEHGQIRIQP
jgi:hypothetical protein